MILFRCVIKYRYGEHEYEIPSNPTSKAHAEWLVIENGRLNAGSEHVLAGRVYSEADYRTHCRVAV